MCELLVCTIFRCYHQNFHSKLDYFFTIYVLFKSPKNLRKGSWSFGLLTSVFGRSGPLKKSNGRAGFEDRTEDHATLLDTKNAFFRGESSLFSTSSVIAQAIVKRRKNLSWNLITGFKYRLEKSLAQMINSFLLPWNLLAATLQQRCWSSHTNLLDKKQATDQRPTENRWRSR